MSMQRSKILSMVLVAALLIALVPVTQAAPSPINVGSWSTAVNGDAETLTISKPSGVQAGQFLLAQITYEKGTDAWPITAPTGWTHIITTDAYQGGGYKDIGQALYWRIAGANEPGSYTWRFGQKVKALGGIISYSGVDSNNPVAASIGRGGYGESTGQNQLSAPSLNAAPSTKLVGFYGFKEQANLDTPAEMNRLYQERDNENDYTILAADQTINRDGPTGERVSYSWEPDKMRESVESKWVAQLVVLRAGSTPPTGQQPPQEITVYVNDQQLFLENKPFIETGRTLVPMRAFFEAMGADVSWDAASRTAIGTRAGITVRIPIDSTTPTVNGIPTTIDVPARIVAGRTYVPLRFVGEALGDTVVWDDSARSIRITR